MGFLDELERSIGSVLLLAIMAMLFVQIAAFYLAPYLPGIAGIRVGFGLIALIYGVVIFGILTAVRRLGIIGLSKSPYREFDQITLRSVKWTIAIVVFALIFTLILPKALPQLFAVAPIKPDFALQPFAVIRP